MTTKSKEIEDTIREQQIPLMIKAFREGPSAILRFSHDEGGIGFFVDLYWKKDAQFRLLALSGKHRMFRHLGRFLKWGATHGIRRVEIEPIELTPEMLVILGKTPADTDDDAEARTDSQAGD